MLLWNSYILDFQLAAPAILGSRVSWSSGWMSQCVSRLTTPTVPLARSAIGFATAYEPHGEFWLKTIGTAPASRASLTFFSTPCCAASTVS